jgi:hypothetical protein
MALPRLQQFPKIIRKVRKISVLRKGALGGLKVEIQSILATLLMGVMIRPM